MRRNETAENVLNSKAENKVFHPLSAYNINEDKKFKLFWKKFRGLTFLLHDKSFQTNILHSLKIRLQGKFSSYRTHFGITHLGNKSMNFNRDFYSDENVAFSEEFCIHSLHTVILILSIISNKVK